MGIANGLATPSAVDTTDLSLGATYNIMVRYNVGTAESKLWVNPTSESSPGVDATDPVAPLDIWTYAFRQSPGIGMLCLDSLRLGGTFASVFTMPNFPPTISTIPDQTVSADTATGPIPFTVGDVESATTTLTLSATSSNTVLVPVANVMFGGSGANRTVNVTPAAGESGTTLITVTVADPGGQSNSTSFLVTVLGANNPPSISAIPDQTTTIGVAIANIPFTVSDLESPPASLNLRGSSTNTALVPDANITFGGSGSNRTVTITPVPAGSGRTRITVFVDDGVNTNSASFNVTVTTDLLLCDTFSYADGPVTTNSGFFWTNHSGIAGQTMVASGKLGLTDAQTEDINATLTNAPFTPAGGATLYFGFTVNFSALPNSQYFAHLKDTGTSNFRARVFATSSNAAPGQFRIGLANTAGNLGTTNPPLARDLDLNKAYRVVVRYSVGTGLSTLWINPASESDTSITATDTPSTLSISTFAFRQAAGIGTLTVDDLKVATTFATAVGEIPPALTIELTGPASVRITWPKAASANGYVLQHSSNPPGGWSNFADQGTESGDLRVVDISGVTEHDFFQLAKP
jgi:hypothetical protein